MSFGSFILLTGIIAVICIALGILFDIDYLRSYTIGEYILVFISCWIPFFNLAIIFFEGSMVIACIFSKLIFGRKWFINFINKKPFLKN